MATIITCVSNWKHFPTCRTCKVVSRRETSSHISEITIHGHNPLPCFSFKGTYSVLAEWLKANGWSKIISVNDHTPDVVLIEHKQ